MLAAQAGAGREAEQMGDPADEAAISERLGKCMLELLNEHHWLPPILCVSLDSNGAHRVFRYDLVGLKLTPTTVSESVPDDGFTLPVNVYFMNPKTGTSAMLAIRGPGHEPKLVLH